MATCRAPKPKGAAPARAKRSSRSLPKNVVRCGGSGVAKVATRFGVKIKIFGKQVRLGSRFADIESAQKVAVAFKSSVRTDKASRTLEFDEVSLRERVGDLTCRVRKRYQNNIEEVNVVNYLRQWIDVHRDRATHRYYQKKIVQPTPLAEASAALEVSSPETAGPVSGEEDIKDELKSKALRGDSDPLFDLSSLADAAAASSSSSSASSPCSVLNTAVSSYPWDSGNAEESASLLSDPTRRDRKRRRTSSETQEGEGGFSAGFLGFLGSNLAGGDGGEGGGVFAARDAAPSEDWTLPPSNPSMHFEEDFGGELRTDLDDIFSSSQLPPVPLVQHGDNERHSTRSAVKAERTPAFEIAAAGGSAAQSGTVNLHQEVDNPVDKPRGTAQHNFDELHVSGLFTAGRVSARTVVAQQLVQVSDRRLKQNEVPIDPQAAVRGLQRLQPKRFQWRQHAAVGRDGDRDLGFIAQEVEEAMPDLVTDIGQGVLSIRQSSLAAVMVSVIQTQHKRQEALQTQLDSALARLESVEGREPRRTSRSPPVAPLATKLATPDVPVVTPLPGPELSPQKYGAYAPSPAAVLAPKFAVEAAHSHQVGAHPVMHPVPSSPWAAAQVRGGVDAGGEQDYCGWSSLQPVKDLRRLRSAWRPFGRGDGSEEGQQQRFVARWREGSAAFCSSLNMAGVASAIALSHIAVGTLSLEGGVPELKAIAPVIVWQVLALLGAARLNVSGRELATELALLSMLPTALWVADAPTTADQTELGLRAVVWSIQRCAVGLLVIPPTLAEQLHYLRCALGCLAVAAMLHVLFACTGSAVSDAASCAATGCFDMRGWLERVLICGVGLAMIAAAWAVAVVASITKHRAAHHARLAAAPATCVTKETAADCGKAALWAH